jgi:hypothetical protein
VVVPSGAAVPECGEGCIGAQLAARSGDGGAVRAGGFVGPGGACAPATLETAVNTHERRSARFIPMMGKRPALAEVPQLICRFFLFDALTRTSVHPVSGPRACLARKRYEFTISENGSAKNAPSAASVAARSR